MTDCAMAAPTRPAPSRAASRTRRARPPGIPRWAWLFGVAVVPMPQEDPEAPQTWVVSAGAGVTHAAAVFDDGPDVENRP